jgi:Kef-type K+ transport system membrane component KefB
LTQILVACALLLVASVVLGRIARSFSQPPILGEIFAGILLGPSVFGRFLPSASAWVFPPAGLVPSFLAGFNTVAAALLLLMAGLEMRWSSFRRVRGPALAVSVSGVVVPFALGLAAGSQAPQLLRPPPGIEARVCALFFATALSISALPVIAKTLLDLELFETRIGRITMAAAMADDLAGWMIFAAVLGLARPSRQSVPATILMTVAFAALALWKLRPAANRLLAWANRREDDSLAVVLTLTLLSAALTEWIGIHALFGAFVVGVALGESDELAEHVRASVRRFVLSFFAPIFIAGIGLKADFVANFDLALVLITIAIASIGKVAGCGLAARAGGLPLREAAAIGICMNARGAMEIILGAIALENKLISPELFVALVAMALVTSVAVGPCLRLLRIYSSARIIDAK